MDSILFSVNPSMATVDDAVRHLTNHEELYWEVGFQIDRNRFSYPILGFMHIKKGQVEYKATIRDIIEFSREHYENEELAKRVKPEPWLQEWRENLNNVREHLWIYALVMTEIMPFSYDTRSFRKLDGNLVTLPPRSYINVLSPKPGAVDRSSCPDQGCAPARSSIAERNLEDFTVHQLEAIEPGLQLEKRQLSTPAGRLDLLCRDANGDYVVVELKRTQGTDQMVGQVLRYMGWLSEAYGLGNVRGILIVGKKTKALSYASMAVPNLKVKEFKVSIE